MKKNTLRLLSSKISAIAILFGPLLLISITGLAFQSNGFFGIKLGVYSQTYNPTADSIINAIKTSDFSVEKMTSNTSCITAVKEGQKQLCIIFPKDFKTDHMKFYADYSRTQLVYLIMNRISNQVNALSSQIGESEAQMLLNTLNETASFLSARSVDVENMQKGLVNVKASLVDIKTNLDNFTVNKNTENLLEDITNDSSSFNNNLREAKSYLSQTRSQAVEIRDMLNKLYSSLTSKTGNLEQAITSFGCTSSNSNDLTSYFDSNNFAEVLQQQANPVCSLLWTMKITATTNLDTIKQTLDNLDATITYLNSINDYLGDIDTNIKLSANDAKKNIEGAKKLRASALMQINNMSFVADSGISTLDSLKGRLHKLSSNLGQLANTDPQDIINPIRIAVHSVESRKIQTLDILFPMMILLIILFVGVLLGNILIMREKTSKAYFRNLILPSKGYIFVIGTYLTVLAITLMQLIIIFAIGLGVFHINVFIPVFTLLFSLIGVILLFSSFGMLIGYKSKSEETSVLISIILTLILIVFSNFINPLETMTPIIRDVAQFSPFNIIDLILRNTMIHGSGIGSLGLMLLVAFILEIVIFVFLTLYTHYKTFGERKQ